MTMLGAHFKISSNGKNPFEKQKAWGNKAKKVKEEFRDPIVYFSLVIATDEDPEELLLARIIHEWQHRGSILLKIKKLQSFESETVLSLLTSARRFLRSSFWMNFSPFLRKLSPLLRRRTSRSSTGTWMISRITVPYQRWRSAFKPPNSLG